jgi:hypothetical protein
MDRSEENPDEPNERDDRDDGDNEATDPSVHGDERKQNSHYDEE